MLCEVYRLWRAKTRKHKNVLHATLVDLPSDDAKQRLPFIKYLYKLGVQQSRLPKSINAASILTFHDSIELFLNLACEEMRKNTKTGISFMEYWDILKELPNGRSLGYKTAMQRLNGYNILLLQD